LLEAETGRPVLLLSGVTGEGVPEVLRTLRTAILRERTVPVEEAPWQP
jgi:GTP-binding protein